MTETAAAPTSKRSWWWWLLLLLLLLLLLFVLLRSCAPQSWLAGLPLSGQTVTEPDRARPPVSDAVPKPPDTVIDRGVAGLRRWWSGQTGQSITDTAGTPVTAGTTGTTTDTSGRVEGSATSTDTPVNNAPETSGVSGESARLNSEAPSNSPTDQTQTPNAGQSANNATPPTTAQTPPTPDATTQPGSVPGAGNPLQIPNSAANTGSTNFLDGRWNAGAGIQDAKTGKPLRMEYDFSQGNGQGKVNIQRGDGTRCTGDVAAQMQGRSLNINDRGVAKCSDGSTMALPKVTCVPTADGRADCQGRYENGTSFPVSMRHAPK